jgi:antitoxin component of MazEF toxin-antitoxin module
MIKSLTKHGNSAALVIEKPILDLLGATIDTAFEVVTDGQALVLTPVKDAVRTSKFRKSMDKVGKRYAKSFEELAK